MVLLSQAKGTLVLVLIVTPEAFKIGARFFMRELSAVLETIAFIKKTDDGKQMIKAANLDVGAPSPRSRRGIQSQTHSIVRRAQASSKG